MAGGDCSTSLDEMDLKVSQQGREGKLAMPPIS